MTHKQMTLASSLSDLNLAGLLVQFDEIAEYVHVQHAAPEAALESFDEPFYIERLGSMKSNAMLLRYAHSARTSAMSSGIDRWLRAAAARGPTASRGPPG